MPRSSLNLSRVGVLVCIAALTAFRLASAAEPPRLTAAFGHADITPDVMGDEPVWIAGYGQNRRALSVHDPLFARCVVLGDGAKRLALVSVDLVGLQLPEVERVRQGLPGLDYVLVSSTHNHEGPDVIGLWGQNLATSGVNPKYLDLVVERTIKLVQETSERLAPVTATFGTADDESLLGDSRQPVVKDGVLRALRFVNAEGQNAGLVVQWNCHPESLGSKNTAITADFCWATVAALEKQYGCEVVLFSGAVGGLMSNPDNRVRKASGEIVPDQNFEYAQLYGELVAELAHRAIDSAGPITLAPLKVAAKKVAVPLDNKLYQVARTIGVLKRAGRRWTGDAEDLGEALSGPAGEDRLAVETEVACLRLGELLVACIPGELYPELVYGKFQEPVEPNVDFPEAPLEPHVSGVLGERKWMLLGLANDEVGYIIPKRQWDQLAPFAYGREKSQYGEINSLGPDAAPVIMEALLRRAREVGE